MSIMTSSCHVCDPIENPQLWDLEEQNMSTKTVTGIARKPDDIRRIYESAMSRVATKGRLTDQGREFTDYITEIMSGMDITVVPFQVAVEYIKEAADGEFDDAAKLTSSLRAFLKTNAAKTNFRTYQEDGSRALMIERVE